MKAIIMSWLLAGAHFAMVVLQVTVFGMMINRQADALAALKADRAERAQAALQGQAVVEICRESEQAVQRVIAAPRMPQAAPLRLRLPGGAP